MSLASKIANIRLRRWDVLWIVLLVYVALYWRGMAQGWLGLDDYALLRNNPHLGDGWASFLWGFVDLNFGRRWTPILWSVANLVGQPTAVGFHALVFVLGACLSCLVTCCYLTLFRNGWALAASLLFVCSPMRLEVFTWEMGFVYETVGIFLCAAFLLRERPWPCVVMCAMALLTYPAAAGACLLAIWYHRAKWAGCVLGIVLCLVASLQFVVRKQIGFIAWHPRFDLVGLVPFHYALSVFWPFATVPVFPPVFYWAMLGGLAIVVVLVIEKPKAALVWAVLLSPVLLAAVTESFWFGARYALITDAFAYGFLCWLVSRDSGRYRVALCAVVIGLFLMRNAEDRSYRSGALGVGLSAVQQGELVGARMDPIFFKKLRVIEVWRIGHERYLNRLIELKRRAVAAQN